MITSQVVLADCPSQLKTCQVDGQKVIQAAKDALAAKDAEIQSQGITINDLTNDLASTQAQKDADDRSLQAWYHNPFVLIVVGVLVGGSAGLYLGRK